MGVPVETKHKALNDEMRRLINQMLSDGLSLGEIFNILAEEFAKHDPYWSEDISSWL